MNAVRAIEYALIVISIAVFIIMALIAGGTLDTH
jgi:Flp pilus assembly pilin Flp